jgi:hypothetical protein
MRYADILVTTGRDSEAAEVAKQIAEIEDSREYVPVPGRNVLGPATSKIDIRFGNTLNSSALLSSQALEIELLIDETGSVTSAEPAEGLIGDRKIVDSVRKRALTWKFRPYVYEGTAQKMRARIRLYYYS